jgi:hypothetical protein
VAHRRSNEDASHRSINSIIKVTTNQAINAAIIIIGPTSIAWPPVNASSNKSRRRKSSSYESSEMLVYQRTRILAKATARQSPTVTADTRIGGCTDVHTTLVADKKSENRVNQTPNLPNMQCYPLTRTHTHTHTRPAPLVSSVFRIALFVSFLAALGPAPP